MRPTTDTMAAVELFDTENPPYSHLGFISPAAPDDWLDIPRVFGQVHPSSHLLQAKIEYIEYYIMLFPNDLNPCCTLA